MLYLWKRGIVWEILGPALPLVFFEIPLCPIKTLSLLAACGLFGNSACHLIVWLSWLSCPRPCINSVNVNVEFYGGIKIFVLLLAKPSNLVSSSSYTTSLLIIVYQTLYLENSVEGGQPKI
jgi:hypothetical protein